MQTVFFSRPSSPRPLPLLFSFDLGSAFARPYLLLTKIVLIVRQISVKSGVSTALYEKSIKLGTLILDIMRDIFKIRGNRDMLCVSQERVVNEVGVIEPSTQAFSSRSHDLARNFVTSPNTKSSRVSCRRTPGY